MMIQTQRLCNEGDYYRWRNWQPTLSTDAGCIQAMPLVFDKPMIYYSLSTLMFASIRDILVISMKNNKPLFGRFLGDGSDFALRLNYATQDEPRGLADAFIVGLEFVSADPVALILGDNIFHSHCPPELLEPARQRRAAARDREVDGGPIKYMTNRPGPRSLLCHGSD
jgi:dTDP-glucose pyrophosphorylase